MSVKQTKKVQMSRSYVQGGKILIDLWYADKTFERVDYDVPYKVYLKQTTNQKYLQGSGYKFNPSTFVDIDSDPLYEVEMRNMFDWNKAIRWFSNANIPVIYSTNYVWEYMLHHDLICNNYLDKYVCLDIEVDPKGMDMKNLSYLQPIVAASLVGSDGREFVFTVKVNNDLTVSKEEEIDLINNIYSVVAMYYCILGWNIISFDMTYIKERCVRLGLDIDWDLYPLFDLIRKYKEFLKRDRKPGEITDNKLDSASRRMLGEGKFGLDIHEMMKLLRDNPEEVKKYVMQDSRLVDKLYQIKGIGSLCRNDVVLSQRLHCFPTKTYPTYIFELYIDLKAREIGMKVPYEWKYYQKEVKKKGAGGAVFEPIKGLHSHIWACDAKCLKPDTKIIVKDKGMKEIKDVLSEDYVLGIRGWHKVLRNNVYDYDGLMVNINGLVTTLNHKTPVLAKRNGLYDVQGISFIQKEKVRGSIIQLPNDYINQQDINSINWMYSELIGILLAEGTFVRKDAPYFDKKRQKHRISKQYRVEISISNEEIEFKERIMFIFKSLFNYIPSIYQKLDGKGITIKCTKKDLYEKIMTKYNSNDLISEAVLRGYMEGDGSVNTARKTISFAGSLSNMNKLQRIFDCLDKINIAYRYYNYNYNGYDVVECEIAGYSNIIKYQVNVGFISSRKFELLYKALHSRKQIDYKSSLFEKHNYTRLCDWHTGKVYDLTLDGSPYYFANGVLTHNSLYPNIIRTHNIGINNSTWSMDKADKFIINTRGLGFKKNVKSINALVMDELIDNRYKYRDLLDDPTISEEDRKWYGTMSDAYKLLLVSANGVFDQKNFKYRNQPIYEATTLTGQWYLKAAKKIIEDLGYTVYYGDSVMPNTPIVIKRNGFVEVIPIEDIHWSKSSTNVTREIKENIEIWTDNGWNKIKYSFKHKVNKKGYRILTDKGYVEVTEDHSLVINGKEISPKNLKAGDKIERYRPKVTSSIIFNEHLAWILGLYVAEGTRGKYVYENGNKISWRIANQDVSLLTKAKEYLLEVGFDTKIINAKDGMKYLIPKGKFNRIFEYFDMCHSFINDEKIVPKFILNADIKAQQAFYDGYFAGDGHISKIGIEELVSIDYSLLEGLTFILDNLGKDYYLSRRKDKLNTIRIRIRKGKSRNRIPLEILAIEEFDIDNFVYDIETENHHFCGGLGGILLHNTDSVFCSTPYGEDYKKNVRSISFIEDQINAKLKEIAVKKFNLDPNNYTIDFRFEKMYSKIYFSEKKNYVGKMVWKDNKWLDPNDEKSVDVKGIVMTKYNTAPIVKEAMKEVFKILLSNLDDEEQLKKQFVLYLSKLKADLYSGKRDDLLVISQKVDRLDGYKNEPAHIRAAKKLDALGRFEPGMNVEFIQDAIGEVILYGIENNKVSKRTYDKYWREHVGKWVDRIAGRDISSVKALDFGYSRPSQALI